MAQPANGGPLGTAADDRQGPLLPLHAAASRFSPQTPEPQGARGPPLAANPFSAGYEILGVLGALQEASEAQPAAATAAAAPAATADFPVGSPSCIAPCSTGPCGGPLSSFEQWMRPVYGDTAQPCAARRWDGASDGAPPGPPSHLEGSVSTAEGPCSPSCGASAERSGGPLPLSEAHSCWPSSAAASSSHLPQQNDESPGPDLPVGAPEGSVGTSPPLCTEGGPGAPPLARQASCADSLQRSCIGQEKELVHASSAASVCPVSMPVGVCSGASGAPSEGPLPVCVGGGSAAAAELKSPQEGPRRPCLVLLDLDNTLIPTGWMLACWRRMQLYFGLQQAVACIRKGLEQAALVQALEALFDDLGRLRRRRHTQIVIVTNAGLRTVQEFYLRLCLPELKELCEREKVYIHSTEHFAPRVGPIPPMTEEEAFCEFYTALKVLHISTLIPTDCKTNSPAAAAHADAAAAADGGKPLLLLGC